MVSSVFLLLWRDLLSCGPVQEATTVSPRAKLHLNARWESTWKFELNMCSEHFLIFLYQSLSGLLVSPADENICVNLFAWMLVNILVSWLICAVLYKIRSLNFFSDEFFVLVILTHKLIYICTDWRRIECWPPRSRGDESSCCQSWLLHRCYINTVGYVFIYNDCFCLGFLATIGI